jgi:hypothetical protein
MTRAQKIIVGIMSFLVIVVLVAVMIAFLSLVRQNRAAQVAVMPTATPFPTVVYPATYTPTPNPATTTPVVGNRSGTNPNVGSATAQPRATIDPNNPVAVAFDAAMKKSQETNQGRFTMDFVMEGDFGSEIPSAYVQDGKVALFALSGKTKDKDTHVALKGMLSAMLGADPVKGIEFITVDGKTYLRGPLTFLGITDDKWYVSSGESSLTPDNASPDQILSGIEGNLDWQGITAAGTEQLDGLNCQVYVADKFATLGGIKAIGSATDQLPSDFDPDNVEIAETKFWLCEDGYFHQMTLQIKGKDKNNPSKTVGMSATVHLYDFDGNFEIRAPENAVPLDMSKFGIMSPTQTPE